jgi:tRNA (uracil-5-)-methyltransferase
MYTDQCCRGIDIEIARTASAMGCGDSLCTTRRSASHASTHTLYSFKLQRIRVKIIRHGRMVSHADLLDIIRANPALRDMSRVKCKYFGKCAGCQYQASMSSYFQKRPLTIEQMLDYSTQLLFKQSVIKNAYRFYSSFPSTSVPDPLPTIGSPLQYGYRTKITPHFDAPPKNLKGKEDWKLWIGFDEKGRKKVLDIEECPIATPVLNEALAPIREEVQASVHSLSRLFHVFDCVLATFQRTKRAPLCSCETRCRNQQRKAQRRNMSAFAITKLLFANASARRCLNSRQTHSSKTTTLCSCH